jgi:gamma-glutamylaminecyclotransferase
MTRIFVYGTLKRGGTNHVVLTGQRFVRKAWTSPGFALYRITDYPGMVPDSDDKEGISGEVWEVDDACLARLDRLEGLKEGLYRREPVALVGKAGDEMVDTYIYNRPIEGRPRLGPVWPV